MVLRNQFNLPFFKLLASEGALESPIKLHSATCTYSQAHDGARYKIFYIEDMLVDGNIQSNAITVNAILK